MSWSQAVLRHTFDRLPERIQMVARELTKFGIVGVLNVFVDVAVFNWLRSGGLADKPLTARAIALAVATTSSYFMNRYWSFRHRESSGIGREYLLFFVLNGVALLIAEVLLFTSHYVLDLDSLRSDNLVSYGLGLPIGTAFRFWSYRRWVFLAPVEAAEEAVATTS